MSQNIFELIMDAGVDADIASMKSKMLILLNTKLNESLGVKKERRLARILQKSYQYQSPRLAASQLVKWIA